MTHETVLNFSLKSVLKLTRFSFVILPRQNHPTRNHKNDNHKWQSENASTIQNKIKV